MNQTTHNQSRKWHRNDIKKLQSQTQISKGADPKFPRNTSFAKKHKKGLKKMQADSAKAMNGLYEAIKALIKTKEVKTNSSKGSSYKLSQLAYITPRLGNVFVPDCQGSQALPKAKAKAQTKPQAVADTVVPAPAPAPAQASKGAQAPTKAPQWRPLSAGIRMEELV
ncbi:60S ribosomal protein L29-like [Eptesicus fuscus]|uniref:60S ribosomal protein L29-like n=1 Tax=Eptesicus fuscus TaxID=29078 RepID=UPI0024048832|nr:60S ribosomal protein L29-like [Eptesicus fuscus]